MHSPAVVTTPGGVGCVRARLLLARPLLQPACCWSRTGAPCKSAVRRRGPAPCAAVSAAHAPYALNVEIAAQKEVLPESVSPVLPDLPDRAIFYFMLASSHLSLAIRTCACRIACFMKGTMLSAITQKLGYHLFDAMVTLPEPCAHRSYRAQADWIHQAILAHWISHAAGALCQVCKMHMPAALRC